MKTFRYTYILVSILLFVSACTTVQPTRVAGRPRPQIELISPPSGTRIILGEELGVESRASDERGLNRIELWVDNSIYRVDEVKGQPSFHVVQRWRADRPGQHELMVQAINMDEQTSQPVVIVVEVLDPALFTLTPTNTPTPTMSLPTETPTATLTQAPSPTPISLSTPTATAAAAPTATATPEAPTATPTPTTNSAVTPTPSSMTGLVFVPAGSFLMGSNNDHVNQATNWCHCGRERFEDELYMHEVYVSGFYIDRYEVTNQQFLAFANATGYKTDAEKKPEVRTWRTEFTSGKEDHPVVWMSWNDANAYCQWAGKRLPAEAEWEKAARGTDGRLWPWGNDWDNARLNMREGGRQTTTKVGRFPDGASPYGAMDMAGNVWEWVNDWHGHIYYQQGENRDPKGPQTGVDRVLRGGAFNNGIEDVRTANRHKGGQAGYAPDHGFRCAKSAGQ